MFRHIVIGYDGHERGGDTIALAERLRDPRLGTLSLVSAYPVTMLPAGLAMVERRDVIELEAEASLTEARMLLAADVPVQVSIVPSASPARALTELAERDGADLVAHERSGSAEPQQGARGNPREDRRAGRPRTESAAPAEPIAGSYGFVRGDHHARRAGPRERVPVVRGPSAGWSSPIRCRTRR